ncbi:hypothetical protein AKO1_000731 [Acrasis kona]|uniref:Uncharacterized protein n=1 Tax=Acrasis kona TaxID=1008807 RepID=A0AAW2YRK2_9EUKA
MMLTIDPPIIIANDYLHITTLLNNCPLNSSNMTSTNKQTDEGNNLFWFFSCDSEHAKTIIETFSILLHINQGRSINSREPESFIGKIKRRIISKFDQLQTLLTQDALYTFDTVEIFSLDPSPYAKILPVRREIHCLTRWSHDGIPMQCETLSEKQTASLNAHVDELSSSYVYGLPHFGRTKEFEFFSTKKNQIVTFSNPYCQFLVQSSCPLTRSLAIKENMMII